MDRKRKKKVKGISVILIIFVAFPISPLCLALCHFFGSGDSFFGATASSLQSSGMLTKEQMVYLFDRFDYLTSQSDVKKRISDDVEDKQEAVAVTTAIQEEIFLEMGIDPGFGIGCLGKLNSAYENDKELMIGFYKFLAKEEMACEEAELGPDGFEQKMKAQQQLQEQQLEMLKYMRKFSLDDQSAILQKLQKQLENAGFEPEASLLSGEEMEEAGRRRVSPVFGSR